jgi:hypothetical protein
MQTTPSIEDAAPLHAEGKINNLPEKSVFWTCVDKLKSTSDPNLQLIGNFIENEIKSAKTIDDQFAIVFLWLNLFGYYPDDLRRKDKVRSNFSDANHATEVTPGYWTG